MVGLGEWAWRLRMDILTVEDENARDDMLSSDCGSGTGRSTVKAFWGLWFSVCDTPVCIHGVMESEDCDLSLI